MIAKSAQPFGKRGRPRGAPAGSPPSSAQAAAPPLPRELVASIVGSTAQARNGQSAERELVVARSFRAALLAGLCVGFFNVALNIADISAGGEKIAALLGQAAAPVTAVALVAGIWGAARTTALTLLVTHRLLAHFGWTSHVAYALGGGAVAALYAAIIQALGLELFHVGIGVEMLSGVGAGFFYRLFAGTVSAGGA